MQGVILTPVLQSFEALGRAFVSGVSVLVEHLVRPPNALVFVFDVIALDFDALAELRPQPG